MLFSTSFKIAYIVSGVTTIGIIGSFFAISLYEPYKTFFESMAGPMPEAIVAIGIAIGMVPLAIVLFVFNLKLQRHNVKLTVRYAQLRDQRAKVSSIRRELLKLELADRDKFEKFRSAGSIIALVSAMREKIKRLDVEGPGFIHEDLRTSLDDLEKLSETLQQYVLEGSNRKALIEIENLELKLIHFMESLRTNSESFPILGKEINYFLGIRNDLIMRFSSLRSVLRKETEESESQSM
jgi:multisubunit Na+/H+ antiporter MnhC subunit